MPGSIYRLLNERNGWMGWRDTFLPFKLAVIQLKMQNREDEWCCTFIYVLDDFIHKSWNFVFNFRYRFHGRVLTLARIISVTICWRPTGRWWLSWKNFFKFCSFLLFYWISNYCVSFSMQKKKKRKKLCPFDILYLLPSIPTEQSRKRLNERQWHARFFLNVKC